MLPVQQVGQASPNVIVKGGAVVVINGNVGDAELADLDFQATCR